MIVNITDEVHSNVVGKIRGAHFKVVGKIEGAHYDHAQDLRSSLRDRGAESRRLRLGTHGLGTHHHVAETC